MSTLTAEGTLASTDAETDSILKIEGLRLEFVRRSLADRLARRPGSRTLALSDVSLSIPPRQALAIVGESGSGKTTLARSLVRLVDPDAGKIEFHGQDILKASRSELASIRRRIQLVYQDPYSSLNSAMRIGDAIIEPALVHGLIGKEQAPARLEGADGPGWAEPEPRHASPAGAFWWAASACRDRACTGGGAGGLGCR